MKKYNSKRIEKLRAELEQYGYVSITAIQWHLADVEAQAENAEIDLSGKTPEDLQEILRDILDNNQDWICEQINELIYDGLVEMFKPEADDDSE